MTGRFVLVLAAVAAVLAGCGGGEPSSDPGSKNYDPAHTTLKAAGLETCSEEQVDPAKGLDSGAGVIAVRGFYVAEQCMGAQKTPNEIIVYQFSSRETLDAGMPKIRAAYPRGEVGEAGPLVIVATGPDAAANLAAVQKAIASGAATSG